MDKDNVDLSKEGIEKLINTFVANATEERELALERYRRQDEQIETAEDFVLQGKNAVDYLKTASERSNSILNAAKLIKDIIYNSEGEISSGSSSGFNDEKKREIQEMMERRKKG